MPVRLFSLLSLLPLISLTLPGCQHLPPSSAIKTSRIPQPTPALPISEIPFYSQNETLRVEIPNATTKSSMFQANLQHYQRFLNDLTHTSLWLRPQRVYQYLFQFKFSTDESTYHVPDYWASSYEMLNFSMGDCEDFALFAKDLLQKSGFDPDQLYLIYLSAPSSPVSAQEQALGADSAHMVLLIKPSPDATGGHVFDDEGLVLDILQKRVLSVKDYHKQSNRQWIYALNEKGFVFISQKHFNAIDKRHSPLMNQFYADYLQRQNAFNTQLLTHSSLNKK